jgi:hypothetical protein
MALSAPVEPPARALSVPTMKGPLAAKMRPML